MLVIKQFGPVTYAMGTLQEILAGTGIAAKVRALPEDVAGCTLEMGADGRWVGTLGSLSKAAADALYASGALANLATGATYRDTSGTQYTYSAGAGWVDMANRWDGDNLLVIGDSRVNSEAGIITGNGMRTYWSGYGGPVQWMQMLLGDQRFTEVHFRGRSGLQAKNVATGSEDGWGITAILASSNAKNVFVRIGTNDLSASQAGNTAESIFVDLKTIVDAITVEGRIAHISTVEPCDMINGYTVSHAIRGLKLNRLIKSRFGNMPNVFVVDISTAFTDWTQKTNFLPIMGTLSVVGDGLHTSVRGAWVAGTILKDHFSKVRTPNVAFGGSHYLLTKANSPADSLQLLANPLLDTGYYPSAGTGKTYSNVDAPNGVGKALQVDVASTASAGITGFANIPFDAVTLGDLPLGAKLYAYARVRISGAEGTGNPVGLRCVMLSMQTQNVSGNTNGSTHFWGGEAGAYDASTAVEFAGDLLIVTPIFRPVASEPAIVDPNLWIYANQLANPAYRVTVYDCGVIRDLPDGATEYAQFWTDTTPPVAVF